MKKFVLAIIVLSCFMTGCKKQCVQPYQTNEIPTLKQDDYNSCEAIHKNFSYQLCNGNQNEFPYWSYQGDTIMICGYLYEYWDGNRDLFTLFDSPDNAREHELLIHIHFIGSPAQLPEEFDISKKCYIKGRLDFEPLYTNGSAYSIKPIIGDIQEVFFE